MGVDPDGPDGGGGGAGRAAAFKEAFGPMKKALQENAANAQARMQARLSAPQDITPKYVDVPQFKGPSFRRGGTMRKSGVARLHEGERAAKGKRMTGRKCSR